MADKVTLASVATFQNDTSAVAAINNNNALITTAFDNTLSRDGTSPNQMGSNLDMNNNQILNLPAPATVNSPARLIDVASNPTIVIPTIPTVRTVLTTNLTLYVDSTNGSDSNNGLAPGTGHAFLTIQKAYDVLANTYDLAGFTATIQLANGTYNSGLITAKGVVGSNGPSSVVIQGSSSPGNVIVSTASTDAFGIGEVISGAGTSSSGAQLTIAGIKITTTGSGHNAINVSGGGSGVIVGVTGFPVEFGTCGQDHIVGNHGAWIIAGANNTVSGNAIIHVAALSNSVVALHGTTETLTGTPTFTYYAYAETGGALYLDNMTWVGSAAGTRYFANLLGVIYANGAATYLPGNSSGVQLQGGFYLSNTTTYWALSEGGTNTDLSATGPGLLQQATSGATVTIVPYGQVAGTSTNDNAIAGSVGEIISSSIASGSAVSLSTATPANVTSISLTAGDWDVSASLVRTFGASTSITILKTSISTTSATDGSLATGTMDQYSTAAMVPVTDMSMSIGPIRLSLASPTTVYLVADDTFTVSTNKGYGILRARRVR